MDKDERRYTRLKNKVKRGEPLTYEELKDYRFYQFVEADTYRRAHDPDYHKPPTKKDVAQGCLVGVWMLIGPWFVIVGVLSAIVWIIKKIVE